MLRTRSTPGIDPGSPRQAAADAVADASDPDTRRGFPPPTGGRVIANPDSQRQLNTARVSTVRVVGACGDGRWPAVARVQPRMRVPTENCRRMPPS